MVEDDQSETLNSTRAANSSIGGSGIWQKIRPLLEQSALNLRVWLPVLRTPDMKGRQVRYRARENRVGLKWNLALPRQCWQCAKTDGIEPRDTARTLRCFDNPVAIVSSTFGVAGALLLLWAFTSWGWPPKLAILLAIGGGVLLFIKSWQEKVRITIWTCGEHAADLPQCRAAVDEDELHLFVPNESLAETARAELQAARRREPTPSVAAAEHGDPAPPPADAPPPPSRSPGSRTALPPLKLAGDEEEPAS